MSPLRIAAILFLLQFGIPALQQDRSKASIEGIVLRASNGEPLSNAQVKLTPVMAEDDSGFFFVNGNEVTAQPAVFTQADGKFAFKDIDPGAYNPSTFLATDTRANPIARYSPPQVARLSTLLPVRR